MPSIPHEWSESSVTPFRIILGMHLPALYETLTNLTLKISELRRSPKQKAIPETPVHGFHKSSIRIGRNITQGFSMFTSKGGSDPVVRRRPRRTEPRQGVHLE